MRKSLQIKFVFFFPFFLFFINLVSKSLFLTAQDIGLDEPFSVYHAQFAFDDIINQLKNYNNPPLFELLLHVWIKIFGISPFAVRALPLIFACLCPVVLFYFGKNNFSTAVGIVSSLLLSSSSLLMFYAHDCRVYTLFLLLCLLSLHLFLKLLKTGKRSYLFILINTLLMYAHYFGIFILLFQGLFLMVNHRENIKKFLFYFLITTLLYLPQLFALTTRLNDSVSNGTWVKPPSGIESLYNMLWAFSNAPVLTVACLTVFFAGILNVLLKKQSNHIPKNNVLILIWFGISYFGIFLVSYRVPIYISRYLIFALPAYYMLLVLSVNAIINRTIVRNALLGSLVLCFAFTTDLNPDKKQGAAAVIRLVKQIKDSVTLVIVSPKDFLPSFAYHYDRNYFAKVQDKKEYKLTDSLLKEDNIFLVNSVSEFQSIDFIKFKKIICFTVGSGLQNTNILNYLNNNYKPIYSEKFQNIYHVKVFKNL